MMKHLTKLSWVLLLSGCLLLSSCDKSEDDPFTGGDNYITSFVLKNGNQTITAAIDGDKIVVTAPATFSLASATAEVTLSENTSIKPNPAAITDWSSEYVFVVTAFNGATKSYTYTISDADNSVPGSVVLRTQAEVDAFGQSGTTTVEGNLIIGMAAGRDSITSIAALDKIKEVGYGVIIKSTYANATLDGLSSLTKVGGALQIETSRLLDARFPALAEAMGIEVTSTTLEKLSCPVLTGVSGGMTFSTTNLSEVDMPVLATVNGNVSFTVPKQNDPSALARIAFPALKQIDGTFAYSGIPDIESIDLPELVTCGAVNLGNPGTSKLLTSVSMPKLEECKGELRYHNLSELQRVELPSLKHAGSLVVYYCNNVGSFDVPKLETVDGDLDLGPLGSLSPEGLAGFRALASVGGTFRIAYSKATSVSDLKLPPVLKSCKTLSLFDCATLKNIDVTGIEIGELNLERATLVDLTIKGNSVFSGVIRLKAETSSNLDNPYSAVYNFPKFDGIQEIGGLNVADAQMLKNLQIAGISKINGDIKINDNYAINTLTVRDLTEVTGDIFTASLAGISSTAEFASIERVGGYLRIGGLYPFACETLSFPDLTEAGGVEIVLDNMPSRTKNLKMDNLTGITDSLKITTQNPNVSFNDGVTNLDGFSGLTNVRVVSISGTYALTSYEGLKNCLPSLTSDDQWDVSPNYNMFAPTLEQMKAGEWNQPGI